MSRNAAKGFTLIELMVVVAIVGIIAAIAIPSYQEQVRKSRRAEAVRAIGQMQLDLERWRAENPCYGKSAVSPCATFTASGTYPADPGSDFYTTAITGATETDYTITSMRAGAQADDRCGNLVAKRSVSNGKPIWATASCN